MNARTQARAVSAGFDSPRFEHWFIDYGLSLGERPFTSTSFGRYSAVLLHLLTQRRPDIPVVWVDTGYNTRTTLKFADTLRRRLDINLRVYRPADDGVLRYPPALGDPEHADFTRRVKLEPFARALKTLAPDVWFSALRREQTTHRAEQPYVQNTERGLLKIAPLLDWREHDMEDYLRRHDLPLNADYYDPTKGEPRRECGLHLNF